MDSLLKCAMSWNTLKTNEMVYCDCAKSIIAKQSKYKNCTDISIIIVLNLWMWTKPFIYKTCLK